MNLYISDLDGTLLDTNAKLLSESKKILNDLITNNNINFTIATARTPATIVNILDGLKLNLPVITMNGSAIYSLNKKEYIYYNPIKKHLIKEIYSIIKNENINAFTYSIKNNHLFVFYDKLLNKYQIEFYNERKNSSLKSFINKSISLENDILYFTILDYKDKVLSLYDKIKNLEDISITMYSDIYNPGIYILEIYDINSSKAKAITLLKNNYNFNKLITFGDNANDIPMFKISDECYSVENGINELKNISTKVIGLNSDNSVAKFILEKEKNF